MLKSGIDVDPRRDNAGSLTRMKLHESNVSFVKFHTQLQRTDFVLVVVLVIVPRPL